MTDRLHKVHIYQTIASTFLRIQAYILHFVYIS